jgi:hypothetical protein
MAERNTIKMNEIRYDIEKQMYLATVKAKDGSCFVGICASNMRLMLNELEEANVDVLNSDGSLYDGDGYTILA